MITILYNRQDSSFRRTKNGLWLSSSMHGDLRTLLRAIKRDPRLLLIQGDSRAISSLMAEISRRDGTTGYLGVKMADLLEVKSILEYMKSARNTDRELINNQSRGYPQPRSLVAPPVLRTNRSVKNTPDGWQNQVVHTTNAQSQ